MSEFYSYEYLSERLAAVCKERDELRREVSDLKALCEKQARLNRVCAKLSLDLDTVTAERDELRARLGES